MNIDFDDSENVVNQTVSLSVVTQGPYICVCTNKTLCDAGCGWRRGDGWRSSNCLYNFCHHVFNPLCQQWTHQTEYLLLQNSFHFAKCQWWHCCSVTETLNNPGKADELYIFKLQKNNPFRVDMALLKREPNTKFSPGLLLASENVGRHNSMAIGHRAIHLECYPSWYWDAFLHHCFFLKMFLPFS